MSEELETTQQELYDVKSLRKHSKQIFNVGSFVFDAVFGHIEVDVKISIDDAAKKIFDWLSQEVK